MKKIILAFFIFTIFGLTAFAQNSALPAKMAKWNGAEADKILTNEIIKSRLQNLLGEKNYADFMEAWESQTSIVKKGNFLFASGCLIHACGHIESAVAIDLVNQTIHAGIYRDTEKPRYFNENSRKTPLPIRNWANHLTQK